MTFKATTAIATAVLLLLINLPCSGLAVSAAETGVKNSGKPPESDQLLEMTEDRQDENLPGLISRLINSAAEEIKLSDWDSAMTSTSRALDFLDNMPDPKLELIARALRGRARAGMGDYKSATRDVEIALRINRTIKPVGRHQEALLYSQLLDIAANERNLRNGNRYATKMLKADRKHFGKGNENYLPTLLRGADWYRISSQFERERKILQQCVDTMEVVYGQDDGRLAHPLRRIAQSHIYSHQQSDEAEIVLRRAMNLQFATPVEAATNKAAAKADLADYIVVFQNPEAATSLYEEAWQIIADESAMGTETANQTFAKVRILYFQRPNKPATGRGTEIFVEGFMQVEFTVTAQGSVEAIDILDYHPPEMKGVRFIQAYKRARYRPRIVDGKVTATPNVRHRSTYSREDHIACRSKVPTIECMTL